MATISAYTHEPSECFLLTADSLVQAVLQRYRNVQETNAPMTVQKSSDLSSAAA